MTHRICISIPQVLFLAFLAASVSCTTAANELKFWGAADISAGVFLDGGHFAVANDESNFLRIYRVQHPEKPAGQLNLEAFLQVDPQFPEADIEAAARVDDRIYWITSHGRNKDGKPRPSRYRFFCTKIQPAEKMGEIPGLVPQGQPCKALIEQLLAYPSAVQEVLKKATQLDQTLSKKEQKKLAPKEQGLNIEGLTLYPPNKSLLIGLRNPLFKPKGQKGKSAILIELLNPQEVVDNKADARFGKVLLWALDNRGIRGMEYVPAEGRFYILAGPVDSETTCAMYQWDGDFANPPSLVYQWPQTDPAFTPEGIARGPDGLLWVFSDDGTLEIPVQSPAECMEGELLPNGNCPNKFLIDPARQSFRIQKLTGQR
ncbi:MAG: DUF3616 domain-containing protein [Planctomycetales bacterium]|nr:DUF3616 domain-containing protein [Planctomycetales bacterium]